ncbi:acetyltransferase [Brumimicrobium salinarum]|uniref:Acetyltransferase n=1 Tax=Brumimicrobium salinarum TaxID=2058658 RepID=A0A2I0R275_9FLAO|nr:lysophospholipid acyltransferase family protein [Brumimicrobium salinarum]PKR80678.1 acetyltransferase [Brumimicrobium salinarum]
MLSALAYYVLIYPLSLLPLRVLYLFTDVFYLLLITIIPYRRKVVRTNIERSFPNKTKKEKRKIERKFYRHLTDLLAEGAKNLSISKKQLLKRFQVEQSEVMDRLYAQGKSVLLVSGHYNNWEWLITGQNLLFKHQAVGIGMPLSNGFWDKKLNARRSRFGMRVIHSKIVHQFFKENKEQIATLVLADQSPGDSNKCYWTDFLNQKSGILFGPEMLANTYNHAVVYFSIHKLKRGHYSMRLQEISSDPRSLKYGELTEQFVRLLEQTINEAPEFWIWSHKRWKRTVPEHLDELRQEQVKRFNDKFRS